MGRLTNSTAVRRTESARENMMHQNFQSFGTPWEISLEGFGKVKGDGEESMVELAIQVYWWEKICRGEAGSKGRLLKREYGEMIVWLVIGEGCIIY
jgi:hypothetical protein